MKSVTILLIVCLIALAGYSQVTPFTGGPGSGFTGSASATISCPLFFGGTADGVAVSKTPPLACSMFSGGSGDGFDAAHSSCEELLTEADGVRPAATRAAVTDTKGLVNDAVVAAGAMMVFPNPASGSASLRLDAAMPVRTQIIFYRSDGRVVKSIAVQLTKGVNIIPLDLHNLTGGLYFIYNSAQQERGKLMVGAAQ